MAQNEFDRERLESACLAIGRVLHELLQQKKINALEFLSMVGHLPVKPSSFNAKSGE